MITAANITDEQIRELRCLCNDRLACQTHREVNELATCALVPGDCPMCGESGDDPCRAEWKRGAPPMKRRHTQRVQLARARTTARALCAEILNARGAK